MTRTRLASGDVGALIALVVAAATGCSSRALTGDAGTGGVAGGSLGTGGGQSAGGTPGSGSHGAGGAAGAGGVADPGGQGGATSVVATIFLSASTNSRSVRIVVYADASAERSLGQPTPIEIAKDAAVGSHDDPPTILPAGAVRVVTFLAALAAVGDLSAIPVRSFCSKSTSFGTATTVTAGGITSGDLQCIDGSSDAGNLAAAQDLATATQNLLNAP